MRGSNISWYNRYTTSPPSRLFALYLDIERFMAKLAWFGIEVKRLTIIRLWGVFVFLTVGCGTNRHVFMLNYCIPLAAGCRTSRLYQARWETAGDDSIVVLSCFILCLCLGCPLMWIMGQPLFFWVPANKRPYFGFFNGVVSLPATDYFCKSFTRLKHLLSYF